MPKKAANQERRAAWRLVAICSRTAAHRKRKLVARWIRDGHLPSFPGRILNPRPSVLVTLRQERLLKLIEPFDRDPHVHARRAVAEVAGQVQDAIVPRHLHVERQVELAAMLP